MVLELPSLNHVTYSIFYYKQMRILAIKIDIQYLYLICYVFLDSE
jgi:hypothetical protein